MGDHNANDLLEILIFDSKPVCIGGGHWTLFQHSKVIYFWKT